MFAPNFSVTDLEAANEFLLLLLLFTDPSVAFLVLLVDFVFLPSATKLLFFKLDDKEVAVDDDVVAAAAVCGASALSICSHVYATPAYRRNYVACVLADVLLSLSL